MSLLNPRVDIAFKILFGSKENKDLLMAFINSVVSEEDQVVDIELLNPYNDRQFKGDKQSILDIKAKDTFGNHYNIEVQISNEGDYDKRSLYYWSKLYANQLKTGNQYCELRKAIGIHVLNFTSVPNNRKYFNKFIVVNEETKERFFEDLAIYTIELDKFFNVKQDEELTQLLPRIQTNLDRWAAFLTKAYKIDRNKIPKELDDPCIKKAFDVLAQISLSDEERELYEGHLKWLRGEDSTLRKAQAEGKAEGLVEGEAKGLVKGKAEGLVEGEAKGLVKGKAEGKEAEKKIIAIRLLAQNMPLDLICSATELSEDQVRELDNSRQK